MDISAIAGLAGSLKTAGDMAKALVGARDQVMIQATVVELQQTIMSAQSTATVALAGQMELMERNRQLEAELERMSSWEAERGRYRLTEISNGVFVYMLRQDHLDEEPIHCICPSCYQQSRKSVLQSHVHANVAYYDTMTCPSCKATYLADTTQEKYPFQRLVRESGIAISADYDPYVGY